MNPSLCIISFEEFNEFTEIIHNASQKRKNSNAPVCRSPLETIDVMSVCVSMLLRYGSE